jgi:hypothetical protein
MKRKLWMLLSSALVMCLWTTMVLAQEAAEVPTGAVPSEPSAAKWWVPMLTLGSGVIVSLAVRLLKGVEIVGRYPKATALVLSALVTGIGYVAGVLPEGVAPILTAILTQLAAAIGTHEVTKTPAPEPEGRPVTS